jgi:hypothetical protein
VHHDRLPRLQVRGVPQQQPGRGALHDQPERGHVVDAVGHRERLGHLGDGPLRVPTAGDDRDHPVPVRRAADHLAARDQRQVGAGQVGVLRLVRVGVVDAGAVDLDQQLAGPGLGIGDVGGHQDLGAAELGDQDRAHGA